MRKQTFFTYTFTGPVIAVGAAGTLVMYLSALGAYFAQWPVALPWCLVILHGIFCALFFLTNYVRWIRYRSYNDEQNELLFDSEELITSQLEDENPEAISKMIDYCQRYISDLRAEEDKEPWMAEDIRINNGIIQILRKRRKELSK